MSRFSKAGLVAVLRERAEISRRQFGFHDGVGWIQVDGKGETLNREYGSWRELLDLVELIESGYLTYPEVTK